MTTPPDYDPSKPPESSQEHSGSGDNVGRDKQEQQNDFKAPVGMGGGQGNTNVSGNAQVAGVINIYNYHPDKPHSSQPVNSTRPTPSNPPTKPNELYYVERPPIEQQCFQAILKDGALIRIKAPEKMGKTLLINQVSHYAAQQGHRIVYIDFLLPEAQVINDSSLFLRWLCKRVSRRLGLKDKVEQYWGQLTPNTDCTDYFEEEILDNLNAPLVLGLDNVEKIFDKESALDFFAMIRAWWGKGGRKEENWHQLKIILSYSTEALPQLPVDLSPFNVGTEIKLPDFTQEQVLNLASCYGLQWSEEEVKTLMNLVKGHPYLVTQTLSHLTNYPNLKLTDLLKKAPTEEGIYCSYLQHYWLRLEESSELRHLFRAIVESEEAIAIHPKAQSILEKMGLISKEDNKVKPRCQLYRLYFRERLKTLQ